MLVTVNVTEPYNRCTVFLFGKNKFDDKTFKIINFAENKSLIDVQHSPKDS